MLENIKKTLKSIKGKVSSSLNNKKREILFKMLEKEAPETLVKPKRNQFDTEENYNKAIDKFNKNKNWATPSKDLPFYKKMLYSKK
jgi:iron-sulfur cluster repair protein YtfE (RIC family)